MRFGYYYDPTYILVILCVVLSMIASARVNSTFRRFNKEASRCGMTGADVARRILFDAGIADVSVQHIAGNLTDHYDPVNKVLRLSDSTYDGTSVAAIGVAAHECGHAIQHEESYTPLKIRSSLVPFANFGSKAAVPIIILGVILSYNMTLVHIGIWVFSLAVLFQLVTLPVEFNASNRAVRVLSEQGILTQDEIPKCKKVLKAAAMTYVAAAMTSIMQLLRLIIIFGGGRRSDD